MTRGINGEHHLNYGIVEFPKEDENSAQHKNETKKVRKMSKFTAKSLVEHFHFNPIESDNPIKSAANYVVKYYKPSGNCMKNYLYARFPFFDWIRSYSIKENLLKDLISGLTVSRDFYFSLFY